MSPTPPIYTSGALVRSIATFTDDTGTLADPSTTTFQYKIADADPSTVTPVHDSTGIFHNDLDTTGWAGPGYQVWTLQWTGTGAVQAIDDDTFWVRAPAI